MSRRSILIVDDDADVRQTAAFALAADAARIDQAETITEALVAASYDCILLDMNFAPGARSGGEGLAALATIRAIDPAVGIVLMTAYGGVALAVAALRCGGDDFLLKPWRHDALIAAITRATALTAERRGAQTLDQTERAAIRRALDTHQGNISQAATALGVTRQGLYRRLAKYGF